MKKKIIYALCMAVLSIYCGILSPFSVFAEENNSESTNSSGTSISLTPTSKILQISSSSTYDQTFKVTNDGDAPIKVEVYAAPYSYVYSSDEDTYKLGFSNENNFTQITRWITFRDNNGNYVTRPIFSIEPKETLEIPFKITTPENIPSGGQYAVIFAHTISSAVNGSGIRTEASPGMVVYGRSLEGEINISPEISGLSIDQTSSNGKDMVVASAKVKNNGNIDFVAVGVLDITPIIGFDSYKSPETRGRVSIIPGAELAVSDVWEDVPGFGIYKATWTVTVNDKTEVIEKTIFRISPIVIIITIIVLTLIIVSVIIATKKRKDRRSRLSV